jgi:hypothetical protein
VFRHFWLDTQLFQTRHGSVRGLLYHLTMSLANACSHALKDRLGSPDRVYLTTSASETKFCYRLVIPLAPPTYYKRVPDRSESTTIYRTLSPPRSPVHPITTKPIFFSLYSSPSYTPTRSTAHYPPLPHAGPYTTHTPHNKLRREITRLYRICRKPPFVRQTALPRTIFERGLVGTPPFPTSFFL